MIWAILFGSLLLLGMAGLVYLIRRISKFRFIAVLSRGKKAAAVLLSIATILLPSALLWLLWGAENVIIVLLHLALFWLIADAVFAVVRKCRGKQFRRYYAGAAAVLVTALYLGVGFYQANHVWQTNYTVTTDKSIGTLRVALLADSHVGTTFDGDGLSKHVASIAAQNPDIVVISGDFVDEGTSREDMIAACRSLRQLDPQYGVYFVFGNHDKGKYSNGSRGFTGDDLIAELEESGVTVLQDESVLIDGRFYLVGRQDASEELDFGGSRAAIGELVTELDDDKYSIVLDHQPRDYEAEAASGVDLVLSGHTHGGQMIPLVQLIRWFHIVDDNVYGYERRDNTDFIVTSGISDWAIQFKTGCISEYVIIDIQGK